MLVATCDDEIQYCQQVEQYIMKLAESLDIEVKCDQYGNGEDLLKSDYNQYQIIFLDIDMGCENGIDIAEQIRRTNEKIEIIFLTAFIQYAVDGYKVRAYRFLVKPIQYDEFVFQLNELFVRINNYEKNCLVLKKDGQEYHVKIQDIFFVEVINHDLIYHCTNYEITVVGTIRNAEKNLKEHYFSRIHKSLLVNMKYIAEVRNQTVLLKNGQELPLARSKKEAFRQDYLNFWGDVLS